MIAADIQGSTVTEHAPMLSSRKTSNGLILYTAERAS
jgi:hypothetical protein